MSTTSKIEWTRGDDGTPGRTWNPVSGCTRVSEGCRQCYIERTPPFRMAGRKFLNMAGQPSHDVGATTGVTLHPDRLDAPLRWRKPHRVFVNSLSDLFHADVPDEFITRVWAVMALAPKQTFQILTKRPARMRALLNSRTFHQRVRDCLRHEHSLSEVDAYGTERFPLPNVHLGVSVENQHWADIRLPALYDTPAAVRFVSCEPLLGPVDVGLVTEVGGCTCGGYEYQHEPLCGIEPGPSWGRLHWCIVGGESGPGARPMELAWARQIRDQCQAVGTPVFVKQMGSVWARTVGADAKGGDWSHWPNDLRVREYPTGGTS